ncbi:hypothetical protein OMK64_12130 [Cellulomonas fimi]|nr:hypothetical protein [Cellulomonas fimi]
MARTRLRSLVQSKPQDLLVRERLADVYRHEGASVEAGRWSYLSEERVEREVTAYERACGRDPVRIMRGLRWTGTESDATTEVAQERLREVKAAAESKAGKKLDWSSRGRDTDDPWWQDVFGLGCGAALLLVLVLSVIGAVTVVRWFM